MTCIFPRIQPRLVRQPDLSSDAAARLTSLQHFLNTSYMAALAALVIMRHGHQHLR